MEGIGHHLLLSPIDVSLNQNLVQHRLDDILNQQTVISTDGFNTFCIHLIELLRVGPVEPGVSLLVD